MPGKLPRKEEVQGWGLEDIRAILDLLSEQDVSEFEMEKNGFRVRIKRGRAQEGSQRVASPAASADPVFARPLATGAAASASATEAEVHPGTRVVKSPIVGTYYSAPGPDAPPFVKVGDLVRPGQVLCIIEAMKLMNEIEAEIAGEIASVFVENGQPVEYGQPLFGIIPAGAEANPPRT
ncbi:MAG: acetyl-CoA carboxylase biotin carboxyl carrier protein [Terriglobia bacterium]